MPSKLLVIVAVLLPIVIISILPSSYAVPDPPKMVNSTLGGTPPYTVLLEWTVPEGNDGAPDVVQIDKMDIILNDDFRSYFLSSGEGWSVSTPNFGDLFIDTVNDRISIDHSSQGALWYDLSKQYGGSDPWTLRFAIHATDTTSSQDGFVFVALAAVESIPICGGTDMIGLRFIGNGSWDVRAFTQNGSGTYNEASTGYTITEGSTVYIELERIDATDYAVRIFNNPNFDELLSETIFTDAASTLQNLDVLLIAGEGSCNRGAVADASGWIDNVLVGNFENVGFATVTDELFADTDPEVFAWPLYRLSVNNTNGFSHYQFPMNSTITDNLLSHFPLAVSVNDNGRRDNDGVVTGTEQYNPTNTAFDFDGATEITLPNEADYDFDSTDAFSIVFTLNSTDTNASAIITKSNSFGDTGWGVLMAANGLLRFHLTNTADTNELDMRSATSVNDGTQRHFVYTYSGNESPSGVTLYINGASDTLDTITDTLSASTLTNNPVIIGNYDVTNEFLTGIVSDVQIYDVAIDAHQARQLYRQYIDTKDDVSLSFGSTPDTLVVGDAIRANATLTIVEGFPDPLIEYTRTVANSTTGTIQYDQLIQTDNDNFPETHDVVGWFQIDDPTESWALALNAVVSHPFHSSNITSLEAPAVSQEYDPDYFTAVVPSQGLVNYTINRSGDLDDVNLKVNRDQSGNVFQIECLYQNAMQAQFSNSSGVWSNATQTGYFNDTQSGWQTSHAYVSCYNEDLLFTTVSYTNSSLALFGLEAFDTVYGSFIGVPVGIFFLVLVAGYANPRTAPIWLVVILGMAGILAVTNFIELPTEIWALALIAGILGLFVGRKAFF